MPIFCIYRIALNAIMKFVESFLCGSESDNAKPPHTLDENDFENLSVHPFCQIHEDRENSFKNITYYKIHLQVVIKFLM